MQRSGQAGLRMLPNVRQATIKSIITDTLERFLPIRE
jgi:hypothetical protein